MLALLAAALTLPPVAVDAIRSAVALPHARVEIASWKADACTPGRAEVQGAVRGSGRVAVRLEGDGCSGWAWAEVKLYAPALVAVRPIPAGSDPTGSVRREEREVLPGRAPIDSLPPGSVASRTIPAGASIEARHLRAAGFGPGEPVRVLLRSGSIAIESAGRTVPCGGGRVCAVLPSGKRVEGSIEGDRLVVEVP